ncbi:hypothetical protein L4G92_08700 [Neisseria sp. ZJ106]|uniref:Membrane protein YkvI n=1 Tax=Neisseria lisongii TaxID=2912188 RepID=A0ABY7RJ67_9NEIS|nr:hypothetical protein [Neisseria lisongii]MCF7522119.1 hypothetical protein [Neisseria lisongii]WCL71110.1 hypothetical protein PJU73_07100 [Neisseria lisongii]
MSNSQQHGVSAFGIASTFIGTIIGAGFASGNEILQYFVSQGWWGLGAILVATVGFYWFGKISLQLGYYLKTEEYSHAISPSDSPWPRRYCDLMITVTLFGTFVIMIAGAGGLLANLFGLPAIYGSIGIGVLVVLNLLWGMNGLVRIQELMVPALIAGCVLVGLFFTFNPIAGADKPSEIITSPFLVHWIPNGILYVAFNFQLAIAVLVPLGAAAQSRQTLQKGVFWGALGLFAGSATIFTALLLNQGAVGNQAYPMVTLAEQIFSGLGYVYAAILVFGLYSTAISCFYGTILRVHETKMFARLNQVWVMIIMSAVGVVLSRFGFSDLIGRIYPILGFGGLLVMVFMIMVAVKKLPTLTARN